MRNTTNPPTSPGNGDLVRIGPVGRWLVIAVVTGMGSAFGGIYWHLLASRSEVQAIAVTQARNTERLGRLMQVESDVKDLAVELKSLTARYRRAGARVDAYDLLDLLDCVELQTEAQCKRRLGELERRLSTRISEDEK